MRLTNRWLVLGVLIAATTIGMMSFAAPFALLPLWIRELGISRAEGGLLSGLWYLPGIAVALPAGWAFDRYPGRRVMLGLWALILAGAALSAMATSFTMLCVGRLVFSIGMNGHMVGAPKLLANWFAGRRELGLVMGLYTIAFTAGVYLALNQLGGVAESSGSASALRILVLLSVVGVGLIALVPGSPAGHMQGAVATTKFRPWDLGAGAWVLGVAYFGFSIGTEAYLTFAPDLLVRRGLAVGVASATIGGYALVALVLKPLLSGFVNRQRAPWFVLAAIGAALVSIVLLFSSVPPRVSSSVMGIAFAAGMPAFLALPALLFPPTRSGQVYGLYQLLYSLGFFAQPVVGFLADRTGSYVAAFGVVAVYTLLGLGVLLPVVQRLRPEIVDGGTS